MPLATPPDAPQVVFFGPPGAGKSTLIAAFLRAADPSVETVPLTPAGPAGVRRELVPHRLTVPDAGPAVICDSDGTAAGDLLAHPARLVRGNARGALVKAVRSADALVLVIDASATPGEVDATFRAFGEFLDSLEAGRTFGREAGGLPVFLTLTKCDALVHPGDEPTDWLARVAAREAEVRRRFEDHFGDDLTDDSPFLKFGSIELSAAATAARVPPGPLFAPYADRDGSFGVAGLPAVVFAAARAYRDRLHRTRRRLRATAVGASTVAGLMLAGLLALAVFGVTGDPLADRVRALRDSEGPPAVRLADPNLERNRGELTAIREAARFDRLPPDLQRFVTERLAENEAYRAYRAKFRPPRLGPPEVRTQDELARLVASLDRDLAPPPQYAAEWAGTDAVRLREKWRTDAELLREAEARLDDWYRNLIRGANALLLIDKAPDFGWRAQVSNAAAAADDPPFRAKDRVPGSPTVPGRRGAALTYAPAFAFDRIDLARRDWDDARGRLLGLRDLTDALGLTTGPGSAPAVLDLPEPVSDGESLALGPARLKALAEAFPDRPLRHPEWAATNFPDPARTWLEPRLKASYDTGTRHARRLIASRLAADTPAGWRQLADGFLQEPAMRDWGHLLGLLRRWSAPTAAAGDPVRDLADAARRDRFDLDLRGLEVAIPDDLLADRLTPAGRLVVRSGAGEFAFRPVGDGRPDRPNTAFAFAPDGHPGTVPYRPGDRFTATLPLRAGGRDYRLTWDAPRSPAFGFDALGQPPTLERVGPVPGPERAPGVRVTAGGEPVAGPPLLPPRR